MQIFGLNETSLPKIVFRLPDLNQKKELIQHKKEKKLNLKLKEQNFDWINFQLSTQK